MIGIADNAIFPPPSRSLCRPSAVKPLKPGLDKGNVNVDVDSVGQQASLRVFVDVDEL